MKYSLDSIMRGRVWKFGDSIDTDIIAPGGQRGEQLRQTTMEAVRPEFAQKARPGDIIVAGRNFGCGSSREKANVILRAVGIQAIVAESVARIFFRVSVSIAFPNFIAPGIAQIVEDGEELVIDYASGEASNPVTGRAVKLVKFSPSVEHIFNAGGLVPLLKERYEREYGHQR